MTIDPRVGFWLSIILAIVLYLGGASGEWTDLLGPETARRVLAILALVGGTGSAINAVLHAIPSKSTPAALANFPLGSGKPEK